MEMYHFVLVATILVVPATAGIYGYQATVPAFTQSFHRSPFPYGAPQNFPFQPLFSYAYQAPVPATSYALPPPAAPYTLQVPATTISRVIYSEPPKDSQMGTFQGFSYQTRYEDGGKSEVVFVTGPDSKKIMEQNNAFFRSVFFPNPKSLNESLPEPEASPLSNKTDPPAPSSTRGSHQSSSVYRFQVYPANVSPLFGAPVPLHSIVSMYHHTFGHSPLTKDEDLSSANHDNAEAQESMISEIGRVLAGDHFRESLITSDENSISTENRDQSQSTAQEKNETEENTNNTTDARNESNATTATPHSTSSAAPSEHTTEAAITQESSSASHEAETSSENDRELEEVTTKEYETSSASNTTPATESHPTEDHKDTTTDSSEESTEHS